MNAPSEPPRPVPPRDGDPDEVVRWVFNVLNRHDAGAYREVLAPDAFERLPTRTLRGSDEIVAWFEHLFAALPDATWTLLSLATHEHDVLARWRLTGTHCGAPFEGLEATGGRIDIDGFDHVTVAGGRVVSNFVVFDRMQLGRQIGLVPTEGSRVEVGLRTAFNLMARRRRDRAGH